MKLLVGILFLVFQPKAYAADAVSTPIQIPTHLQAYQVTFESKPRSYYWMLPAAILESQRKDQSTSEAHDSLISLHQNLVRGNTALAKPLLTKIYNQLRVAQKSGPARVMEAIWILQQDGQQAKADRLRLKVEKSIEDSAVTHAEKVPNSPVTRVKLENGLHGVFIEGDAAHSSLAGYQLDVIFGTGFVPVTVPFVYEDKNGAFQLEVPYTRDIGVSSGLPGDLNFYDFVLANTTPITKRIRLREGGYVMVAQNFTAFKAENDQPMSAPATETEFSIPETLPSIRVYNRVQKLPKDIFKQRLTPHLTDAQIQQLYLRVRAGITAIQKRLTTVGAIEENLHTIWRKDPKVLF